MQETKDELYEKMFLSDESLLSRLNVVPGVVKSHEMFHVRCVTMI